MKIAIFHNYMDNIGGAEIVTLILARELNADIYTTNIDSEKIKKMGFKEILPKIFSIGKIPKNAPFRHQIALWKFRNLNLSSRYDFFIISGDWAMSGAVNNKPNLWYVHSPLNELWQFKEYIKKELLIFWKKPIFDIWVWINRKLTLNYSKHVNVWICNSQNTKNRIKKFYKKEAIIINPPVDTEKYFYNENENYWLSVNRLSRAKRIELQINAFKKLPNEKLVIIGSYEQGVSQFESYKKYIESIKTKNIEIIHWADFSELIKKYSKCKGFITTAKDEDFGMTVVEAMASGKPVIAPNEGGYKESIINGENGILIDNINEQKIINAVIEINKNYKNYKDSCQKRALDFDTKKFIEKIKDNINKSINL